MLIQIIIIIIIKNQYKIENVFVCECVCVCECVWVIAWVCLCWRSSTHSGQLNF